MRILYIALFIIVIDQVTKLLVKGFNLPSLGIFHEGVPLGSSQRIIGDFLRLTYIENSGLAFGIDFGGRYFLTLFVLAACIGILLYIYYVRHESFWFRLPLALILGGAVGNLIDRMFYGVIFGQAPFLLGSVVDFIDVEFFNINFLGINLTRWPIFNIADAAVTCGVILLLFTHRKTTPQKENEATSSSTEKLLNPKTDISHPTA